MFNKYDKIAFTLIQTENTIQSISIIEGEKLVVYSTIDWKNEEELELLLSIWDKMEINPIKISGKKYSILQTTPERLIATSIRGEGHIVAVQDESLKIIALLKPTGTPSAIHVLLARKLRIMNTLKPYMDKDTVLGRNTLSDPDEDFNPPESKPLTEEEKRELEKQIDFVAQWIVNSRKLVFFTGAGLSTESGIPDFRSEKIGLWTRKDQGLRPLRPAPEDQIKPNSGHIAIVDLLKMGKVDYVISQNSDGLHLKSGIPPERLAELHGNKNIMICTQCERKMTLIDAGWDIYEWGPGWLQIPPQEGQPNCQFCQGRLISTVVGFGQNLEYPIWVEAKKRSEKADLYFVVGSKCEVTPAATLPNLAKINGAKLIILNLGETPIDNMADIRFFHKIGDVLPIIVEKVKQIC